MPRQRLPSKPRGDTRCGSHVEGGSTRPRPLHSGAAGGGGERLVSLAGAAPPGHAPAGARQPATFLGSWAWPRRSFSSKTLCSRLPATAMPPPASSGSTCRLRAAPLIAAPQHLARPRQLPPALGLPGNWGGQNTAPRGLWLRLCNPRCCLQAGSALGRLPAGSLYLTSARFLPVLLPPPHATGGRRRAGGDLRRSFRAVPPA